MKTRYLLALLVIVLGAVLALTATAQEEAPTEPFPPAVARSPLHPTFALLDADGVNVLASGAAVSAVQTCGTCHDAAFIVEHNTHATSAAAWNPVNYHAAGVLREVGAAADENNEMNCFLCHVAVPNNTARLQALASDQPEWSAGATLLDTDLISYKNGVYNWNRAAFDAAGNLLPEHVTIQDPSDAACGQCHGLVHTNAQVPLVAEATCDSTTWTTYTTGQIVSPQRIASSGLNLAGKTSLSRTWDIHAERVVGCTDCHYASNNPVYYQDLSADKPEHLLFDPRRLDFGDYLYRPLHQFDASGRTCADCHDATSTHTWLPYTERHISALACESCHVPQLYAPALQAVDWTVLDENGAPRRECRGIAADGSALIEGYQPALLPSVNGGLTPYNLVTAWYWVAGDAEPVALENLSAAWLADGGYAADVLAVFDRNADGNLSQDELLIDTPEKEAAIATRLAAQGLQNPRIVGEVLPYAVHHNVTGGAWAIRDCQTCHAGDSLVNAPLQLARYAPTLPTLQNDAILQGALQVDESGALFYQPDSSAAALYVLGHDSVQWVDLLGVFMFLGVMVVVGGHSTLRYLAARRRPATTPHLRRVYMYSVYERQWHWLQTAVILGLLFTGLIIHKPDIFGLFSFRGVVLVHNVLAVILIVNAALAAFYHLASGDIRQFIPQPRSFLVQSLAQARYYGWGIFRGEPHPFEKSTERKMNPLQQLTYLAILNILLPLQVITGALMWGAQRYPDLTNSLGGLPFLAPLHTLVAWAFAAFILAHVYLTTTAGHTPLGGIRAMVMGWDDLETHEAEDRG